MTLAINDLTAGPDDPPKVEVLLTDLDAAVASVTAYRLSNGFELQVRGIIDAAVAGAGTWIDFEVPAQQATYRVEYFDDDGVSLGFSESVTVTLGFSGCWMHNPLNPGGAVKVDLMDTAGAVLSRPVPGAVVYPRGRRVGIAVAQPRRGLAGVVFDVTCHDLDTADQIQAFLGTQGNAMVPVICIRLGVDYVGLRVHSPLFLGVFDIAEEGIDVGWGGTWTRQRMQGDEAAPPAPGLFIPLLRRMDLNAYYASREDLNNDNLTRLAVNRRYDLAGVAGA
jgi:hypothetical protein